LKGRWGWISRCIEVKSGAEVNQQSRPDLSLSFPSIELISMLITRA
jgi:hypothetical protein